MDDTDTTIPHRPREDDTPAAGQPPTKRQKLDDHQTQNSSEIVKAPLLPPSHALLGITRGGDPGGDEFMQMLETDVGISEYVDRGVPPIQAVIKQRYAWHFRALSRNLRLVSQIHGFFGLRDRPERQSDSSKVTRTPRTLCNTRHSNRCPTARGNTPNSPPPNHALIWQNTHPGDRRGHVCFN